MMTMKTAADFETFCATTSAHGFSYLATPSKTIKVSHHTNNTNSKKNANALKTPHVVFLQGVFLSFFFQQVHAQGSQESMECPNGHFFTP